MNTFIRTLPATGRTSHEHRMWDEDNGARLTLEPGAEHRVD